MQWLELIGFDGSSRDAQHYAELLGERACITEQEGISPYHHPCTPHQLHTLNTSLSNYCTEYYKHVTAIIAEEALGVTLVEGRRLFAPLPVYLGFIGKSQPAIVGRKVLDACITEAAKSGIHVNNVTFDGQYMPIVRQPELDMFTWVQREAEKVKALRHDALAQKIAQCYKRVLDISIDPHELLKVYGFVNGNSPSYNALHPVSVQIRDMESRHLSLMNRDQTPDELLYAQDLLDVCTSVTSALLNPLFREQSVKCSINVNTCSLDNLQELTGIGPERAKKILEGRNEGMVYGEGGQDVHLTSVDGIGAALYASIRSQIRFDGPDYVPGTLTERKRNIDELRALYKDIVVVEYFTRNTDTRPTVWDMRARLQQDSTMKVNQQSYRPAFASYNLHSPEIHPATSDLLFVTPCSQHVLKCIWHNIAAGGHGVGNLSEDYSPS